MKAIKTILLTAAITALCMGCGSGNDTKPAIPVDNDIEKKVENTLKKMTLEEKIGQMAEITSDCFFKNEPGFPLDEERLNTIIDTYKVGSLLNAPNNTPLSHKDWNDRISTIQELSMKSIGIPCIYGLDMNHGVTYSLDGTLGPQNINMAATFNRDAAHRAAEICAYETRACNCPWTYSPTLDLSRDQRWPRAWENFGEDAYLSSQMAIAMVKGFQGDDPNHIDKYHVATSIKHYMAYGVPRTGKDRTPAYVAPNELKEKHFAPYKAAVEAGALTLMVNSGSINGVPVHASYELLTEWLKEGLNWDGMIVTDWADINNLYQREKVAVDKKDAIRIAINAGIDMSMDPYDLEFCVLLKELVDEGKVKMSRIDDAVRRVLRLKYRLGLFDNPSTNLNDYPLYGSAEFADDARANATESMVLLKNNNNRLPLAVGTKILVTGPNANSMRCLNGGWTLSWQGEKTNRYTENYNTILESMQNVFGKDKVVYEPGVTYNEEGPYYAENTPEISKAVAAARGVDVIVACVGENSYCETPGNLDDLWMSDNQRSLVKALAATGKPVVLVLNEGRARLVSDIEPLAEAVVDIMLPGNYGGEALANLLAGKENFSGRLPFTYPRHNGALMTYDYKVSEETSTMDGAYDYNAVVSVQWPFGYGLSYTTVEYSNLQVDKTEAKAGDTLTFTVDVKNTGNRDAKESVLLFTSDLVASVVPDNRRLRAFDKVAIPAGETRSVTLSLAVDDLAFVTPEGNWLLEPGDFRVQVGTEITTVTVK